MRLGHGVREGPRGAEVTFATTGYIVRLIANSPGLLDSHTHLIIDEVGGCAGSCGFCRGGGGGCSGSGWGEGCVIRRACILGRCVRWYVRWFVRLFARAGPFYIFSYVSLVCTCACVVLVGLSVCRPAGLPACLSDMTPCRCTSVPWTRIFFVSLPRDSWTPTPTCA